MFWIGLIVGLFIGASIGLVTACFCISAKMGDQHDTYNGTT